MFERNNNCTITVHDILGLYSYILMFSLLTSIGYKITLLMIFWPASKLQGV